MTKARGAGAVRSYRAAARKQIKSVRPKRSKR